MPTPERIDQEVLDSIASFRREITKHNRHAKRAGTGAESVSHWQDAAVAYRDLALHAREAAKRGLSAARISQAAGISAPWVRAVFVEGIHYAKP